MEVPVDSRSSDRAGTGVSLRVSLLGPLTVHRDGVPQALPASRKVRALLAYLLLAPRAVTRSQLCELLWDSPNDPRGELRWCLSKIRGLIDTPHRRRVNTRADAVSLDLADASVDAIDVNNAVQAGIETLALERLRALSTALSQDFLERLEIDRCPAFTGWLVAQRQRFRSCHTAVLDCLVGRVADDEIFAHLETWRQRAPFDRRVHSALLDALARCGRLREGDEHVAATARLFEAEGLDPTPVRQAWRAARARKSDAPPRATSTIRVSAAADNREDADQPARRRASIAVMPFVDRNMATAVPGGPGDGLAHDVITRLAKLRSLFVIAQGTVFALRDRSIAPAEVGRLLNVDYVASGWLRHTGRRVAIAVELAETRTARIVWAEVFDHAIDDSLWVFDEIGNRIVASIAHEIETLERNRAILQPPNSLNAWQAHHRGLWHMYRFNKADNDSAQHFFETAVRLDPTFARAYAGLSFTHFQNAFQGWADRAVEIDRAMATAGQSLLVDDRDPTAHWAMGRALWLQGRPDHAVAELESALELSPNFAMGHYTLAFVQAQAGDPQSAIRSADHSRHLSPFDPLLFGMLGARAMALVRLGQYDDAAGWGIKAAARPNAHAHILAIAAYCLALADRLEEAQGYAAAIRRTVPAYHVNDFLTAMRFAPDDAARFRAGARRIGMG
ncbi:MAG TPA: transcriptional regulator [Vineibacter sp.]|nr:transcriptional regulator [Vineibacter sp.]